jgi:hypothetical protein
MFDSLQLEQAIQIIQSTDKHEDVSGKPFSFKISLGNDISGVKNIAIILSEYWLEGVDGGDYNIISLSRRDIGDRSSKSAGCTAEIVSSNCC